MTQQPVWPAFDPRVGLFWFVSTGQPEFRLVSLTWPFDIDAAGDELRAVFYDHIRAWPKVQRLADCIFGGRICRSAKGSCRHRGGAVYPRFGGSFQRIGVYYRPGT